MKKLLTMLSLALVSGAMVGCASYQPEGALFNNATMGISANPGITASKTGRACAHSYLGLIAIDNASIESAMKNGNITKVATVNQSTKNILGLYGEYCTIVTGQ